MEIQGLKDKKNNITYTLKDTSARQQIADVQKTVSKQKFYVQDNYLILDDSFSVSDRTDIVYSATSVDTPLKDCTRYSLGILTENSTLKLPSSGHTIEIAFTCNTAPCDVTIDTYVISCVEYTYYVATCTYDISMQKWFIDIYACDMEG